MRMARLKYAVMGLLLLTGLLAPVVFAQEVVLSEIRVHGGGAGIATQTELEPEQGVIRLTGLRVGQTVTEQDLLAARDNLQLHYRQAGYLDSRVGFRLEEIAAPAFRLHLELEEGEPVVFKQIELQGELPREIAEFSRKLVAGYQGQVASVENIRKLSRELLVKLRGEGYLQASVRTIRSGYVATIGGYHLVLSVTSREPLTITFEGNREFSPEELLAPLKIETRTVPFSPSAIASLTRDIARLYESRGFYLAKVEYQELPPEGSRRHFRITIEEGRRYQLSAIEFRGNSAIESETLHKLLVTSPGWRWPLKRWRQGYLQREVLESDLDTIRKYYQDRGYWYVEVDSTVEQLENDKLKLIITVREATPVTVQSVLRWVGVDDVTPFSTVSLDIPDGGRFNQEQVDREQLRLRQMVADLGFPNVAVDLQVSEERTLGDSVKLEFVVTPGVRVAIGKVEIEGNYGTGGNVIERELLFRAGDLYSLDQVKRSEQRLYSTSLFGLAEIGAKDGVLDEAIEEVVVRVRERDTGVLGGGVGFNTDDGLHLSGELSQRNLYGSGNSVMLSLDGYFKTGARLFDAGDLRAVYTQPHTFGRDTTFVAEGFVVHDLELLKQFSVDRVGAVLSLQRRLFEGILENGVRSSVSYTPYSEHAFDLSPGVEIQDVDSGSSFYSTLKGEIELDRRDDSFNPRSGYRAVLEAELSSVILGSDVELFGSSLQQSYFLPLTSSLVWANNFRVHYYLPLGDTEAVPVTKRIFLGGRNSLRGFSVGQIGPRAETGEIVGGDLGLILNTELQQQLSDSVAGVLFLDIGRSLLLERGAFDGADPKLSELKFGDLRLSPGLGFRYQTPVGPLSVEYGVALDREFGERFGRLNIAIGGVF